MTTFLALGLLLSIYQGYRGFIFQWIRTDNPCGELKPLRKALLLALSDGIFYFATTASGFVSLTLCQQLATKISDVSSIAVGTDLPPKNRLPRVT
jgi:hypothetical protein